MIRIYHSRKKLENFSEILFCLAKHKKRRVYTKNENLQVEFVMHKTNFDTLCAINYIGKLLHKPTSFFGIAGTKVTYFFSFGYKVILGQKRGNHTKSKCV